MRVRFTLLCLSSLLAVYFGFFHIEVERAFEVVGHLGYWFILSAFLLFVWSLWQILSVSSAPPRGTLVERLIKAKYLGPALAVFAAWLYLVNAQPTEFKLHMDEPVLAGTAKQMHLDRTCYYFTAGYNIQNMYYPHSGAVDKRPLFYPLLVSLLHDLTGYRVENSFHANAILLLVFLGVAYHLGSRLFAPLGGYIAIALLATLPLLPVVANSGGFDLLNVTMIGLFLIVMLKYLDAPNQKTQSLLLATTILLVQSRYESAVFVLPVVVAVLWHWWQKREIEVSAALILTPVLLIPFALQRVMMKEYSSFWQMQEGRTEPFSLSYFGENLEHARLYFFSTSGLLPNSLLLSLLAVLSLGVMLWGILSGRWAKSFPMRFESWIALSVCGLVLFNFALLMFYHWGHLDDLAVTRIALPFICLQVGAVLTAFKFLIQHKFGHRQQFVFLCIISVYFVFVSLPAMARTDYVPEWESESLSDRVLELTQEIKSNPLIGNPLLISDVSIVSVLSNISSISTNTAVRKLAQLELHMYLKTFDEVFILYIVGESFLEDNFERLGKPLIYERIEKSFILTDLEVTRTPSGKIMRLARVEGIRGEVLPETKLLRPDWGRIEIDYTGKISQEKLRGLEFVESLPK